MVHDLPSSGNTGAGKTDAHRVASLRALYRKADRRARARNTPLEPLKRAAIYAERLR